MRLKVSERQHTVVKVGTITIADIRKKFNLPDNAELTAVKPYHGDDCRQETVTFGAEEGDITSINVRVERVK